MNEMKGDSREERPESGQDIEPGMPDENRIEAGTGATDAAEQGADAGAQAAVEVTAGQAEDAVPQADEAPGDARDETVAAAGGPETVEAEASSADDTVAEARSDMPANEAEARSGAADDSGLDLGEVKRILETALLVSTEPMTLPELKRLFDQDLGNETLRKVLDDLRADWEGKGVELTNVASGWRFRARPEYQRFLDRLDPQKPPKYSRAVLETLAIIAYKQPVTRGDIEDIRGVTVSSNILKSLEARGWIDVVGHREVPGRPALYATTKAFLDDLNLRSLEELPALDDLGALVEQGETGQLPIVEPPAGDESDIGAGEGGEADDERGPDLSAGPDIRLQPIPPHQLH